MDPYSKAGTTHQARWADIMAYAGCMVGYVLMIRLRAAADHVYSLADCDLCSFPRIESCSSFAFWRTFSII